MSPLLNIYYIYCLVCLKQEVPGVYVGHSTNLQNRIYRHKHYCNTKNTIKYNFKVYKYIRDNGGWENWTIIVIDTISVADKREAEKIERYYIEKYNATLNIKRPFVSKEEGKKVKQEYNKTYKLKKKQISELVH
jgi:hypothetical protein